MGKGIGGFSELKAKVNKTNVGVGLTSLDLNLENSGKLDRNTVLSIRNTIGGQHSPKPHYTRKSDVKSAGGYPSGECIEV